MRTMPYPQAKNYSQANQLLLAGLLGIVGFFFLAGLGWIAFQVSYSGRIYPGVKIDGVDVSGLSPAAASAKLTQAFSYPQHGNIFLLDGDMIWKATPGELGLFLDPEASAKRAYQIGRSGNVLQNTETQLRNARSPLNLAPVLVFDQRMAQDYLIKLAKQIDKPVIETSLGLNGVEVVVNAGQKGRELDLQASLDLLSAQLQSLQDGSINLVVKETPPLIGDVSQEAELARNILSQPLTLSLPDDQPDRATLGPWTIDQRTLAAMLVIEQGQQGDGGLGYQVTLKSEMLRTYLKNLAPNLNVSPQDARYIFNDDTKQLEVIQHAVTGRALDVEATIQAVKDKVALGDHTINLKLTLTNPVANDETTGKDLGITELIHAETSYFYGSPAARVQNIKAAAAKFHGLLVPPNSVFSMASALGDISLDNGYAEALIIANGRTITGVGGGVCQVSTTLFREVFFSGYPIVERHAHAYRVSYYEKVAGNRINPDFAGLDATVFVPLVDFKFKNDTPYWLLMETYVNPAASSITWKFYSTSDGRQVSWDTTGPVNIVKAPDPVYKENPDLPKGKINQVDYAADGADVTVTRTVTRNNEVIISDTIRTHFEAWAAVYEYGPGTDNIPTPKPTN
jgi:vancomycin resistance protein YoaR